MAVPYGILSVVTRFNLSLEVPRFVGLNQDEFFFRNLQTCSASEDNGDPDENKI
jgi:hypothetical protein